MIFETFPKIDAHFHATYKDDRYIEIAQKYNIAFINVNTDAKNVFPPIDKQEEIALEYQNIHPEYFFYICTFAMENKNNPDWADQVIRHISQSIKNGAVGVKCWKNIGMEIHKDDGSFLMIDDDLFKPVFHFLSNHKIPMLGHLGEPRNCWLPVSEMTTERNKTYFSKYPEFHAYLHPEIPDYLKQIEARDRVLKIYPELLFVGAHLGSLEWNFRELAQRFDKYPNFCTDLSSRIGHLQLQSNTDYEGVRNFMIKYADRIIYGTDAYNNLTRLESALINDWKYLATAEEFIAPEIEKPCRGLNLPEEVLYKIYYANATRTYHLTRKTV